MVILPADAVDVTPLGRPAREIVTVPVNPFFGVTTIFAVPVVATGSEREVGAVAIEKEGAGTRVKLT